MSAPADTHESQMVAVVTGILCLLIMAGPILYRLISGRRQQAWRQVDARDEADTTLDPTEEVDSSLGKHDKQVFDALADGTIRLLRTDWLRDQAAGQFVLKRRQDLHESALLPPQAAALLFLRQTRQVCVLSYGWLTALHCDPHGLHARRVIDFLTSTEGACFEALFWDFGSLMQKPPDGAPRGADEERMFQSALKVMAGLYASAHGTSVFKLSEVPEAPAGVVYNSTPYSARGWPKLECYSAMIMVGVEVSAGTVQHDCPKLIASVAEEPGGRIREPPEPSEFARELASCRFTGGRDEQAKVKDLYLDFYLSVGVRGRAELKMREMVKAAERRGWRLRRNAIGGGTLWMFLIGAPLYYVASLVVPPPRNEYVHLLSNVGWMGAGVCALALKANDTLLVRYVVHLGYSLLLLFVCIQLWGLLRDNSGMWLFEVYRRAGMTLLNACTNAGLHHVLYVRQLEPFYILRRLWMISRLYLIGAALIRLVTCWPLLSGGMEQFAAYDVEANPTYPSYPQQINRVVLSIVYPLLSACLTPARRSVLQSWLAKLGSAGASKDEGKHAALAALFGNLGSDTRKTLNLADESFRLLPFDKLSGASDFPFIDSGGRVVSPGNAALPQQAQPFERGVQGSIFVSHSWRDDPHKKWRALERWARERTILPNTTPLLWLDAACVDREKVTDSLALLPLYTHGCQYFLMLVGRSYMSRLWTIFELFCFLYMGGTRERVIVLALDGEGSAAEAHARALFDDFRVENAACSEVRDTHRLLGCIEAGFGTHTSFNRMVRQILAGTEDAHYLLAHENRALQRELTALKAQLAALQNQVAALQSREGAAPDGEELRCFQA